jgi:hypothetical protein
MVGEREGALKGLCWGKPEAKGSLESLYVDVRIILKFNFKKQDGKICIGLIWLRRGAYRELW